jgi:hypothetical protein
VICYMELLNKLMKKPLKLALAVVVIVLMVLLIRKGMLPTTIQVFNETKKPAATIPTTSASKPASQS